MNTLCCQVHGLQEILVEAANRRCLALYQRGLSKRAFLAGTVSYKEVNI